MVGRRGRSGSDDGKRIRTLLSIGRENRNRNSKVAITLGRDESPGNGTVGGFGAGFLFGGRGRGGSGISRRWCSWHAALLPHRGSSNRKTQSLKSELTRWGCSSVGRALRSQCRGREFKSLQLHFTRRPGLVLAINRKSNASPGQVLAYVDESHHNRA